MIEIQGITKKYGEQLALDSLSFSIKKGEVVGFLGPNGAGKSTMMKIVTGYLLPTEGTAFVNGYDITKEALAAKRHIGYLPEHNPLYTEMYVKEYLGHIAKLYKLDRVSARVAEMVERVGLGKEQHKQIAALSKGYRQRVGLAQALLHDPEVLILDEPTTGLDPNQIVEIRNLIVELGKNKTIVLSTHIMQEVEAICSRVMIVHNGKLVADGSTDELIRSKTNEAEFLIQVEFEKPVDESFFVGIDFLLETIPETELKWQLKASADIRKSVFERCVQSGNVLLAMSTRQMNLEGVFRLLTK